MYNTKRSGKGTSWLTWSATESTGTIKSMSQSLPSQKCTIRSESNMRVILKNTLMFCISKAWLEKTFTRKQKKNLTSTLKKNFKHLKKLETSLSKISPIPRVKDQEPSHNSGASTNLHCTARSSQLDSTQNSWKSSLKRQSHYLQISQSIQESRSTTSTKESSPSKQTISTGRHAKP